MPTPVPAAPIPAAPIPAAPNYAPACAAIPCTTAAGAAGETVTRTSPDLPLHPSDLLLELIVAFLAPLFISGTTDPGLARLAAIEAFAAYQAQTRAELLSIAQIIAFSLAAMDTLRLAMMPDLSLSMKLRLRGCANGLNRSAQQNVRALDKLRSDSPRQQSAAALAAMSAEPAAAGDEIDAVEVKAAVDEADAMVKEACARMQVALHAAQVAQDQPAPTPSGPTPPASIESILTQTAPDRTTSIHHDPTPTKAAGQPVLLSRQQQTNLMWANAMTDVAAELTGDGEQIPGRMSKSDLMWAGTLSSVAKQLAAGTGSTPKAAKRGPQIVGSSPPTRR